jgi:PHD/YefM family antitoxin component YafN of YafNO toxin-antitoxin module
VINIRPVSDLRNKFPEIEELVIESNQPVYLTKNGYGSMVLLSLEQYSYLTDEVELLLDEADKYANLTEERFTGEEVFMRIKKRINE